MQRLRDTATTTTASTTPDSTRPNQDELRRALDQLKALFRERAGEHADGTWLVVDLDGGVRAFRTLTAAEKYAMWLPVCNTVLLVGSDRPETRLLGMRVKR